MISRIGKTILKAGGLVGLGVGLPCQAQDPGTPPATEQPLVLGLPVRITEIPGTMNLKVIEGGVVRQDDWLVVLGGMKEDFTASPSIQLRTPKGAWRPIGARMLEARIDPRIVELSDDRLFVWGGYGGSARTELIQLVDGEVLRPRVAGSARSVTPPPGTDFSDASNPVGLADDVVGLVVNDRLHRFDTSGEGRWLEPIPLGQSLQGPTLAATPDGTVLACGTDASGSGLRVVEIDVAKATTTPWKNDFEIPALGGRLHRLPDDRFLLVGWTRVGAGIESGTILVDPERRTVTRGPDLPVHGERLNWISSRPVSEGILVVGSERAQATEGAATPQPTAVGFLIRTSTDGSLRVWGLSNMPPRRRPMLVPLGGRSAELLGGYRFGTRGASMENTALLVNYGTGLVGD